MAHHGDAQVGRDLARAVGAVAVDHDQLIEEWIRDSRAAGVSYRRSSQEGALANAYIFPGQGSQTVGMGQALAEALAG